LSNSTRTSLLAFDTKALKFENRFQTKISQTVIDLKTCFTVSSEGQDRLLACPVFPTAFQSKFGTVRRQFPLRLTKLQHPTLVVSGIKYSLIELVLNFSFILFIQFVTVNNQLTDLFVWCQFHRILSTKLNHRMMGAV